MRGFGVDSIRSHHLAALTGKRDLAITRRVLLQSGAALAAAPVLPLAAGVPLKKGPLFLR